MGILNVKWAYPLIALESLNIFIFASLGRDFGTWKAQLLDSVMSLIPAQLRLSVGSCQNGEAPYSPDFF